MSCTRIKALLSPYLDGSANGGDAHRVSAHLQQCEGCRSRLEMLKFTQSAVAGLGRRPAPPELALRIKLALSREGARTPSRRWQSFTVRLEHVFSSFMVPATAGALSALVIFGLLVGMFALPSQLRASNDVDLPLGFSSKPELDSSLFGMTLDANSTGAVLVEASVDKDGRLQDYRVLSPGENLSPEIKNMLLFTTFRPAMSFGRPTAGTVVLAFSKVSVRG